MSMTTSASTVFLDSGVPNEAMEQGLSHALKPRLRGLVVVPSRCSLPLPNPFPTPLGCWRDSSEGIITPQVVECSVISPNNALVETGLISRTKMTLCPTFEISNVSSVCLLETTNPSGYTYTIKSPSGPMDTSTLLTAPAYS